MSLNRVFLLACCITVVPFLPAPQEVHAAKPGSAGSESTTSTIVFDNSQPYTVSSWAWSATQSGSTHLGAGAGTGKASFSDLNIEFNSEELAVQLLELTAKGMYTSEISLISGNFTIDLENAIITTVGMSSQGLLATINFARYTITAGDVTTGFDIAANSPL